MLEKYQKEQKKSSIEIECLILEWFVGKDNGTKAIKDNFIISEELVEQRPELVSSSEKRTNYFTIFILYKLFTCTKWWWKTVCHMYILNLVKV